MARTRIEHRGKSSLTLLSTKVVSDPTFRSVTVRGCQDLVAGFFRLPPIFSQVPLATYFHDAGSLSTVLCPAHACLPAAQSFWPAFAMPKHLSLLASGATGAAETDAARPSASKPATAACIVVCCFMNVSP